MKYPGIIIALFALTMAACSPKLTAEQQAAQQYADSVAYNLALHNLEQMEFIIPAQSITVDNFPTRVSSNMTTNFIAAHDGMATIQVASIRNPRLGPNGLGGVTIEGRIRLLQKRVEKNGNTFFEFAVTGANISARLTMTLPRMGTYVAARISGNFSSRDMTMGGNVEPFSPLRVTMGRAI